MADALLVVLLSVAALSAIARRLRLPEPLLFLLGGGALSFVPGLPTVTYDADIVFLVFFPVLLFSAALDTSWNDLRPNALPTVRSALGIVITTTLLVGLIAHALIPELPWAAAFLLGAILADPDFRLFLSLAERVRVPRPMRVVLGGEGLFEGTAQLVLYLALSAAVTTGTFTLSDVAADLVIGPVLGFVVGLAAAWLLSEVDRRVQDPALSITLLLAAPFVAYFPAEALGGNRLTAVVAAGLYLGWTRDVTGSAATRLSVPAIWAVLALIVNGFIYVPAGLALPDIIGRLGQAPLQLAGWVLALTVGVLAARLAWGLGVEGALAARRRHLSAGVQVSWAELALGSWAATRGVFALASALALPLATEAGAPFPQRDLLIALSLGVVLVSIAVQGTLLPVLLRRIGLPEDFRGEREEALAWQATAEAALRRLEALQRERALPDEVAQTLRLQYRSRRERYSAAPDGRVAPAADLAARYELIAAERTSLRRLRDEDRISDTVFRNVQRELDLTEQYFGSE